MSFFFYAVPYLPTYRTYLRTCTYRITHFLTDLYTVGGSIKTHLYWAMNNEELLLSLCIKLTTTMYMYIVSSRHFGKGGGGEEWCM